jgi:hypothetical protein
VSHKTLWRTPVNTPKVGDTYSFTTLKGYKMYQDRPYDCRYSCVCGTCNGVTIEHTGVVTEVIYWADNSIDLRVLCADGQTRKTQFDGPHGDLCF